MTSVARAFAGISALTGPARLVLKPQTWERR